MLAHLMHQRTCAEAYQCFLFLTGVGFRRFPNESIGEGWPGLGGGFPATTHSGEAHQNLYAYDPMASGRQLPPHACVWLIPCEERRP